MSCECRRPSHYGMWAEPLFSVSGPNGFERRNMTQPDAEALARRMLQHAKDAGWGGVFRVFYRDGSVVWAGRVGA